VYKVKVTQFISPIGTAQWLHLKHNYFKLLL